MFRSTSYVIAPEGKYPKLTAEREKQLACGDTILSDENMKALLLSFFLISGFVGARAADDAALHGKWKVHITVGDSQSDEECTLTQNDKELTGSCVSDRGTSPISGKVDGKKVSWISKSQYQGNPLTLTFNGTLESTTMITGTLNVAEYNVDGGFTATHFN